MDVGSGMYSFGYIYGGVYRFGFIFALVGLYPLASRTLKERNKVTLGVGRVRPRNMIRGSLTFPAFNFLN